VRKKGIFYEYEFVVLLDRHNRVSHLLLWPNAVYAPAPQEQA